MNKWLRLAVFAFIGILVSSLALTAVTYINGGSNANMGNMNMGTMNSQNMNMGTSNPGSMDMGAVGNQIGPMGAGYGGPPWVRGGLNPMRNWMFNGMNTMRNWAGFPNQYMNMGPGQITNMYPM
jgi:hypothetical protein